MRPTSYIMLFGALMFVTNLRGCESFNLNRNASSTEIHFDHDSQEIVETTTVDDDLIDSRENRTVTDDNDDMVDSLDPHDDRSLEDAQNATTITENGQLDDIRDKTSLLEVVDRSIETTTVGDDHLDHDDDVKQFDLKEVDRDFSSEWKDSAVQPTSNSHTQFESQSHVSIHADPSGTVNSELVANNHEAIAVQTSNFDRNDHSVEVQDDHAKQRTVEPKIVADVDSDVFKQAHKQDNVEDFVQPQWDIHSQLPFEGPFVHPKSDDWFLVKQYMDDYFFWELEDDISKDYFWQPFKNATAVLDFIDSSAERLNVEQFAQFTPVQPPMEDHLGSAVVV